MYLYAFAFLIGIYSIVRFFVAEDAKPIFGVYHQKSKWYPFKYAFFLVVFQSVRCIRKWMGDKSPNLKALDRPLPLRKDIKAFDGVQFAGGNRDGYYFVMTGERCHKHVVNGFFYLLVPKIGLLCSPKIPDTILFDGGNDYFGAEGMIIAPTVSMKKWKLRYRGFMWLYPNKTRKFRVRFVAQWSTNFDQFNCFEQFHPGTLARSIARESWTNQFFDNISCRRSVDILYYQMGSIQVDCSIGSSAHDFCTLSVRSHSYGTKRDLQNLHRAAHFNIFLDNGMMAVIGVVSQRNSTSSLEFGYVQKPDGVINSVEWCDFRLYQHGECGKPPIDHGFQFKAGDAVYTAQIKVLYEHMHFIGWNWEVKVILGFVKCVVNGVFGQGISEFHYRNATGRPPRLTDGDPSWFQVFRPQYIYS